LWITENDDVDVSRRSPELPLEGNSGTPIDADVDNDTSFIRDFADFLEGFQNIFFCKNHFFDSTYFLINLRDKPCRSRRGRIARTAEPSL
jgi:hypothetical protein